MALEGTSNLPEWFQVTDPRSQAELLDFCLRYHRLPDGTPLFADGKTRAPGNAYADWIAHQTGWRLARASTIAERLVEGKPVVVVTDL